MQPIVSIDPHKETCTYILKHEPSQASPPTQIPSTRTDLTRLAETHPDALFLLEAMGPHEWMHDHLTQHGCEVFVGHPIKREQNEDKSDGEDAKRFAARYQVGDVNQVHVAKPEIRKIRDLVRTRTKFKAERTRMTNRITSTLSR